MSWLAMAVERCRKADPTFRRVTPHDLRHTAASLAISAGANPKVVQRILGHAIAAMTLDVHADLFESDLESVAENVATGGAGAHPFDTGNRLLIAHLHLGRTTMSVFRQ
jgi:integrase